MISHIYQTQGQEMESPGPTDTVPDPSPDETYEETLTFVRRRRIRLCCMTLLCVQIGLYSGITAPAIPELEDLLQCDVAQLSSTMKFGYLGVLLGSVVGALVADIYWKHVDLVFFITCVTAGLVNIAIPWSQSLPVMGLFYFTSGLCQASMDTMSNTMTMLEWVDQSGPPVNLLHAAFTLGLLLAPITTAPFLSPDNPQASMYSSVTNQSFNVSNATTTQNYIYIPYGIHGTLGVLFGLPFIWFYVFNWEYKNVDVNCTESFWDKFVIKDKFTAWMTIFIFILFATMQYRDTGLGLLNFSIAISSPLNLSKRNAAMYVTTYNACWLVSRITGIILSKYLRISWILFGGLVLVFADGIVILTFGLRSVANFWVLTCLFPLFTGPFYPTAITWINQYVPANGAIVGTIVTGIGVGGFVTTWASGYLYLHYGPYPIFGQLLVGTFVLLLITVPLQIVYSGKGNRFKQNSTEMKTPNPESRAGRSDESAPLMTTL